MTTPAHHLHIGSDEVDGNDGLGRYVLLPGDPSRAEKIAEHFQDRSTLGNPRGHTVELGTLRSAEGRAIDVMAVASGIGSASVEVVVSELLSCGARRLLRVGSCGTMVPEIVPGQLVIATGAVRDERTSRHYAPLEYPAVAHPDGVRALAEGARLSGLENDTFLGICHSKASLYGREFGRGPAGAANLEYTAWLRRCGVIATEMETSALLVLAATHSPTARSLASSGSTDCRAAAVFAVFGTDDCSMTFDADLAGIAEERAIRVALAGVGVWVGIDGV
ncbi:MAG: nucleoside phosphorylase [Acidobacteriota bacterium]|nr:nucleoside phosphorylase [Acidobacteriota bacterium]